MQGKEKDRFVCCCNHKDHEDDCKWLSYSMKEGKEKACKLHTPNCKCPRRYEGFHKTAKCKFLTTFKCTLDIPVTDFDNFDENSEELLCCCKKHFPHNENNKILIVKRPQFQRTSEKELKDKPLEE
jgi:hypothetical protein